MIDLKNAQEIADSLLESLSRRSLSSGEIVLKSGRSRRCQTGPQGRIVSSSEEQGWAVRATSERSSLFVAGSGTPSPDMSWPEPDGQGLQFPPTATAEPWHVPGDLDASLMSETESISLLSGIERELAGELPGVRILAGQLEEGTSETSIFNNNGVAAGYRSRAASLHLQVVGPWSGSESAQVLLAEREVRRFQPRSIAKRLVNRLLVQHQGVSPTRERGEMLLSPAVGARLLAGLQPMLLGFQARELAAALQEREGQVGSSSLTVIDDGRLEGGVLEAPVDGEGLPTRRVVLIDRGEYVTPIVGWEAAVGSMERGDIDNLVGHRRRESWRDPPRLGPSHLYIQPDPDVTVASLLASITRGQYLIEPRDGGRFDFDQDRFRLQVCGFDVQRGRAVSPLSRVWIEGSIGTLLRGVQAVGRDLAFEPIGGMIGSPSLLVSGLELRGLGDD